jgi:NAD(P)-dependent dehydrogenase (short-subunit alcohol dehydrogenase family)
MAKLQDKVVLVTGGTSGIGLASAKLFIAEGAQVIVTGRDEGGLASARAELGPQARVVGSGAGSLADIDALLALVKEHYGRLDVLFLNAGVAQAAPLEHVSEAQFDDMFGINVKGAFFTIQKALPLLGAGGSIIVTTSITNQLGNPAFSVYGATKAALRSLVMSLGLELIPRGIRINAISPGPIATAMFDRFGLPQEVAQATREHITQKSPIKRFGDPAEVAKLALFLASDDSSYIVGEEIVVDGGMTLL